MNVTVYFATNRVVTNAADAVNGYPATMIPPLAPQAMTYGEAFISGIDIGTNAQGVVAQIANPQQGGFPPNVVGDIANAGRNLLIFIHGFDNTFSDAVTRAGFNAAWLAASGNADANTSVIAFSWPSKGELVSFPIPQGDYLADQHMAQQSGLALMDFLANLAPIVAAARAAKPDLKVILLAHSMGNLALQSAVEAWFLNGNGNARIFDEAILAAGDCPCDTFNQPNLAKLSGLGLLAGRVSVYYSHVDHVLQLSMVVNLGAQRLGQDGPPNRTDPALFPPAEYAMVDCSEDTDYDFDFLTSHQYYRQSPKVRAIIAASI